MPEQREMQRLKSEARRLLRALDAHYDRYDCGRKLADYINPDGLRLAREFNAVWQRIKALDPSAPESPYA